MGGRQTKWAERTSKVAELGRGEDGSRDWICKSQSQRELKENGDRDSGEAGPGVGGISGAG